MDFVTLYEEWRQDRQRQDRSLAGFLRWLSDHCGVEAGFALTDDELEAIARLSGSTPRQVDEALVAGAWP